MGTNLMSIGCEAARTCLNLIVALPATHSISNFPSTHVAFEVAHYRGHDI